MPDIYNSKKEDNIETKEAVEESVELSRRDIGGKTDVKSSSNLWKREKKVKDSSISQRSSKKEHHSKFRRYRHNPLDAFIYRPEKANFIQKEQEEKIILLIRKHPITNIKWIVTGVIMMFAPAFFSLFSFFENLPGGYQTILIVIWYLIVFAFVFEEFLLWFFHVNIVTDERVFDVDFVYIFYREMTDANIDQIQDVTVQVPGGVWTAFNVGNVIIQTAAETPRITFEMVPKPDEVANILRELRVEEEVEKLEGRVR